MDSLILKLVLTPTLIGMASLAGRRWGPSVSGWLVGLPLTSGPVAFFLALNHGTTFAAAAAVGTLTGTISQVPFCLTYAWLARHAGWPLALGISYFGFAAATVMLQYLVLPLALLFPVVIAALVLALRLLPPNAEAAPAAASPAATSAGGKPAPALSASPRPPVLPRWDIPLRMTLATAIVLLLTSGAPILGPRLTGLLTPFPLYASILGVFAHRLQGASAVAGVLRGLVLGLFAFASFFLVLALLIGWIGLASAFAASIIVALIVQSGSLWVLRHTAAPATSVQSEV
jgi:hypothetical protein